MKHWQSAGGGESSADTRSRGDDDSFEDAVHASPPPRDGDEPPCTTLSRLYGSGAAAGQGAQQLLALFQSMKQKNLTTADCLSLVPLLSALQATPAGGSYPVSPAVRSLGAALSGAGSPLPESVQRLLSPLASNFTDLHPIGRGGFGSVFSATSVLDGRRVALKRVPFRSAVPPWAPPAALAATNAPALREIRALAALSHPNVVRYFTAWTEPRWDKLNGTAGPTPHAAAPPSDLAQPLHPRLTWHNDVEEDAGAEWSESSGASSISSITASAFTWQPPAPLLLEAAPHSRPDAMTRPSHGAVLWPWTLFVAMELCVGPTLGEWLSTGPRDTGDVLGIMAQVAQGLAALSNVSAAPWVVEEDESGSSASNDTPPIAATRAFSSSGSDGHDTRGVGTATYAAPEQLHHSPVREPGPWSDVYSLGLVLVECLAAPFATAMERADTLVGARTGRLSPRLEERAPGAGALSAAMLHPEPLERPSAAEVATVLQALRAPPMGAGDIDALRGAVEAKARELEALERQLAVAMAIEA